MCFFILKNLAVALQIAIIFTQCLFIQVCSNNLPAAIIKEREEEEQYGECEKLARCSSPRQSDNQCHCDNSCVIYDDCCADASPLDLQPRWKNLKNYLGCRKMPRYHEYYPVRMVTQCPKEYPRNEIRSKCEVGKGSHEDILLDLPVSESSQGIVFSNVYCALCHDIEDFVFWDVSYEKRVYGINVPVPDVFWKNGSLAYSQNSQPTTTQPLPDLGSYLKEEGFYRIIEFNNRLPMSHPRLCLNPISDCPPSWEDRDVKDKCLSQVAYIYSGFPLGPIYKNSYCALCHGRYALFSCILQVPTYIVENVYSYSLVLDFNSGSRQVAGSVGFTRTEDLESFVSDTVKCGEGEIYDPYREQCRRLTCPRNHALSQGHCVPQQVTTDISNISFLDVSVRGPDCVTITLQANEYELLSNSSVFIYAYNQTLHEREYYKTDNNLTHVCASILFPDTEQFTVKFGIVQGYLSLCLQVVSLTALIIHFTVYSLLPPLRNTPGKCLMSLVAFLFTAQLLLLLGMFTRELRLLCTVIAVAAHYTFLAVFSWMGVIAFDVWHTFNSRSAVRNRQHNTKKFKIYFTTACFTAMVLVLLGTIVDFSQSDIIIRPYYGIRICWINSRSGLFYLFALPAGLMLLVNFCFFIMTAVSIHQTSKETTLATRGTSPRRKLIIFVKLAVIMGLTWTVGFLAAAFQSDILWYLFVIFNASQGLLICIGFVCNKKVFHLLKECWNKSHKNDSQHLTKSTTLSSSSDTDRHRIVSNETKSTSV